MQEDFDRIVSRAASLRLTPRELIDGIEGLSYTTYWRAREGHVDTPARVRVLRTIEGALDRMEAERAS